MQSGQDDFVNSAVDIIPGRFAFVCIKRIDSLRVSAAAASGICYCIDDELQYMPFFGDFGPLNLGQAFRFCRKTSELLQEAERRKCKLYCYTGPHGNYKANCAVLVGIYQVIFMQRSADEAYKPLSAFKPYIPFRDASCGVSSFHLTVLDCMRGIQKARDVGFIDWNSGRSTFNLEDYEQYEQVEQGDMNWILPGKLLAFSGPASRGNEIAGYRLFTPEDYWDIFKRKGITTVVRLNKKSYDRKRFTDGGLRHHELYFPDGSCPSDAILFKFLELAEAEPGALAIHCKAGLGRTGVLICSYLMKHYRFTGEEVIGYIRICRPGSVIGPQQNYIRQMEPRMWHEGDLARARSSKAAGVTVQMQDLSVSGLPAGHPGGLVSTTSDVPLSQYSRQQYGGGGGPTGPPSASSNGNGNGGSLAPGTPGLGTPSGQQPLPRSRYTPRAITPQRSFGSSVGGYVGASGGFSSLLGQQGGSQGGSMYAVNNRAPPASQVSKSYPAPLPVGRSPSADPRALAASLRATLHTDTLRAADRQRPPLPERHTQSADMHSSSWAKPAPAGTYASPAGPPPPPSYLGPSTPSARTPQGGGMAPRAAPNGGGLTRGLAPNGQPRKVPVGMLGQYMASGGAGAGGGMGGGPGRPASSSTEVARARSVSLASMRNQLQSK